MFVEGARSRYPYSRTGELHLGRQPGVFDPLIGLTVAAAVTERIRLGTSVLILPERHPVVLAQEVVALDHASAGRVDLGVGVGWLQEEFEALEVPWERRGERADDYLRAMRVLWQDEVANYAGEFVSFRGCRPGPSRSSSRGHPSGWAATAGRPCAAPRRWGTAGTAGGSTSRTWPGTWVAWPRLR